VKRLKAMIVTTAIAGGALAAIPGTPAGAGHVQGPYFDLGALPETDFDGKQIFDGLKQFVAAYPYRLTGNPTEILAGQHLYDEMVALDYETSVVSLGLPVQPPAPGVGLKAIRAIKRGTTRPNEWIMFVGHYDTVPQTIDGAYDNGAGTNLIRFLAKELADVETNRSMVFTFYNGEEEGLLASSRDASALQAAGQQITAVLGFDMVGIAYPVANPNAGDYCLCLYRGANDGAVFDPLLRFVNYDFLELPEGNRLVRLAGANIRNSDESSFASRGYRTLRWAGMRTAGAYNGYHMPNDTIENIVAVAGGEQYYEAGIENTMKSAYYTALAVDNHLPTLSANIDVIGSQASVAATADDEDGPVGAVTIDWGDGDLTEGPSGSHTYAPGEYTLTVTVADNLHPQVTRSIEQTVVVS